MKTLPLIALTAVCCVFCGLCAHASACRAQGDDTPGDCETCHEESTPGLYKQWQASEHAMNDVTCIECHAAGKAEGDAFLHHGEYISALVTPNDCGTCHDKEAREVADSYHATAGLILESQDAYLANVAAGEPASVAGCESCHGAEVKIDPDSSNRLSPKSWPNSGIGRLNPDGSKGACTAYHTRHLFSAAQARQPESCSKCHLGPDHPQREVYEESKHGNAYYTNMSKMNIDSNRWIAGVDYYAAPTCATCHMSATADMSVTHDVGRRIAWTLRPPVSAHVEDWRAKRERMKRVCVGCHAGAFADGHFYQFDAVVRLYDEKFGKPAGELMNLIRERGLLKSPASFGNGIEWTYWELWHHEGRRARHGAAMMGPDYTWWHGMYEVAQHFYFKMLPEARTYDDPEVNAWIDALLENDPMHQWITRQTGEIKEDIKSGRMQEMYESMFQEE